MNLKSYKKEELEAMPFTQIAEIILTEKGSAMKIVDIFKKICKALGMSEAEFENKIADFFELLSTDKNFIILDKGKCDLRKRHDFKVVIEEDDDDSSETIIIDEDIEEENSEEEDLFYDNSSDEDDLDDSDDEDELKDFIVVDEDEEASM